MTDTYRILILLSGSGTNLQSIIDKQLPAEICAVISNCPDAMGLERAKQAGLPALVVDHREYDSRESFDEALKNKIEFYQPDLIVLAGFMRILGDDFVNHFYGKIINLHPSLLPAYKGMHTHHRVIEAGEPLHGSSVHFVSTELDSGPVFLQARLPVLSTDSPASLELRIKTKEHIIYPTAISWLAEGRIQLNDDSILMDDERMQGPVIIDYM